MSEWTKGLYRLTQIPVIYGGYQRLLGSHRARQRLADETFRLEPDLSVLDLGCGKGDVLPYLGNVRYVGIDRNDEHIAAARERFASEIETGTARFVYGDFAAAERYRGDGYDRILCLGLLHHLDDERVRELAALTASMLAPDGCLVTVDPAYTEDQHFVARKLADWDSGRRVRSPEAYVALLSPAYAATESRVFQDLLRVPYTHCVVRSTTPSASPAPPASPAVPTS